MPNTRAGWWISKYCELCAAAQVECAHDRFLFFGRDFVAHIAWSGRAAVAMPQLVTALNKAGVTIPPRGKK